MTPEQTAVRKAALIASLSVLYPEDRTGYETAEDMRASYLAVQQSALKSYPGANGDLITAMSMMIAQLQSVISGARGRLKANAIQIAALSPDDRWLHRIVEKSSAPHRRSDNP
jgi:hypothetical protein